MNQKEKKESTRLTGRSGIGMRAVLRVGLLLLLLPWLCPIDLTVPAGGRCRRFPASCEMSERGSPDLPIGREFAEEEDEAEPSRVNGVDAVR